MPTFEEKLDRLAEVAVKVGVNLQKGQSLFLMSPIDGAPLTRKIVEQAYRAGAEQVEVEYNDDQIGRRRMLMAGEESLNFFPPWRTHGAEQMVERGYAFINVYAPNPKIMEGVDPKRMGLAMRAAQNAMQNVAKAQTNFDVPWTILSAATQPWADEVFADLPAGERVNALWDTIFKMTRVDGEISPIDQWKAHTQSLMAVSTFMNDRRFRRLHYKSPVTELTIELPEGHIWLSGEGKTTGGVPMVPNLPTEEVFTLPHRTGVNGTVRSTLPLNYQGILIEGISLTFKDGEIVAFSADKGEEALRTIIETDDGARRLGEVAIVPQDSPIARSGRLYYNTLFDENASCHLAIGRAYGFTLEGGRDMSEDELVESGANRSLTHVDFMIGSDAMDISGETADGKLEPLLKGGRWARTF